MFRLDLPERIEQIVSTPAGELFALTSVSKKASARVAYFFQLHLIKNFAVVETAWLPDTMTDVFLSYGQSKEEREKKCDPMLLYTQDAHRYLIDDSQRYTCKHLRVPGPGQGLNINWGEASYVIQGNRAKMYASQGSSYPPRLFKYVCSRGQRLWVPTANYLHLTHRAGIDVRVLRAWKRMYSTYISRTQKDRRANPDTRFVWMPRPDEVKVLDFGIEPENVALMNGVAVLSCGKSIYFIDLD